MFENLTGILEAMISPWGWLGVFVASILEEVIAPIPSALVMMTAGFILVTGPVELGTIFKLMLLVGLPAAAGVTIGSLWVYGVAYWGGRTILEKWGKWIGLYWSDVEKMKLKFESSKSDEIGIIGVRILPIVPSVAISAFCGFIRMRFWKYIFLTFVGMFFRALFMGFVGWQVGNVYYKYADFISRFEKVGFLAIVFLIVFWLLFFKYRSGKSLQDDQKNVL